MSQIMEKIKRFIIKHDELFFILLFFAMILGITIYIKTVPEDEVWNFENIYKIYNGYKIYIDANVITTPLFHFIGVIMFKLFGANFFIFKLYGVFINLFLMIEVYKIFKSLKIKKWLSLFFSIIVFIAEINTIHNTSNYNNLCLAISLFGILIILNRNKYTNNKFIIIESIISFIILFTKQNIGTFYLIGFIIYNIIYEKGSNRIINILKMLFINLIFIVICMVIFYNKGILDGFISYAILGIREFSQRNFIMEGIILKIIGISIINLILIIFINKSNIIKKEEKKNANIITCFAFPFLIISYPIFNVAHIDLSLFLMYILLIYIIYLIFLDMGFNKNIINTLTIFIIVLLSSISFFKIILYFCEIDYTYEYNNLYFGSLLSNEYKNKIKNVTEYIEKSEEKVIVFSTEAALYMMPLNRSNGSMDEPLLGNFGKDGENGVIEEIFEMENTKILINKDKKVNQESDKIIQYIRDNLNYVGEIEDLLIYQTKK